MVPQSTALGEHWPASLPAQAELADVPFFAQDEYQCGPATLAMVLAHDGASIEPRDLVSEVYLPARHGSLQLEMLAAARRHGFVSYALDGQLESVLREVAAGNPVIVLQDFGVWPVKIWHYAVVVGFDRGAYAIVLRSGLHARQVAPFGALEYTWKGSERWAMVATRPDRIPATADVDRYTEAVVAMARVATPDHARRAYEALLRKWPGTFTALVGLANILYASRELESSEQLFREALAQRPSSVPVMNNLAMALAAEGRVEEALRLVAAAEREPGPYGPMLEDTRKTIEQRRAAR